MKTNNKCRFRQLIDITAVDYIDKEQRFKIVYLLLSHENNLRIVINTEIEEGMGEKIISHLIDQAKQIGINKLSTETGAGEFFAPARKLFKKFGFEECKPFAHYKEDPNSCYYTLNI